MASFIQEVLNDLKDKNTDTSELVFILPSKRAGIVLKNELSRLKQATFFTPDIFSIEEFVEELSNLKSVQNIELLFLLYQTYLENTEKKNQESFDSFLKWAQILLQDFNEIDRYIINPKHIFSYLEDIEKINSSHWSLEENQTEITKKYLKFWSQLNHYYNAFSNTLISLGIGYQGLIYREATDNIESYIQANGQKKHVFIGFNALNKSESIIIQALLHNDMASVYWDIDQSFMDSQIHTASHFVSLHKKQWAYYKTHSFNWLSKYYSQKKEVQVIGVPQNIGQAKVIGELLSKLNHKNSISNTAVVLGDESLLIPVLNSLPKELEALNITMGFPLKYTPLTSLFDLLLAIHSKEKETFYFKDVISILSHQFIRPLFNNDDAESLITYIKQHNLIFVSKSKLLSISRENNAPISLLFSNWNNSAKIAIKNSLALIIAIKNSIQSKQEKALALEYLYRFNEVFNMLQELNSKYNSLTTIKILQSLYKELVASETLDFKGEPLQGLQIMGMLESRVLDFETIILSSVNEGILPSGKSNNSFIPFDVKLETGLPTYKEKDAVYTYHFYRLLQRAKNVFLIYNTEVDPLNGSEKSRFISQLEVEGIHHINHTLISPKIPKIESNFETISKDKSILSKLKNIAETGFSPSSLISYIRNPIEFYHSKILGIRETDHVEEVVAANTLGTVIHNTLEDFYKPLEGYYISTENISSMFSKIEATVKTYLLDIYKEGDITKGKNLIIFEIAKRYVSNFLNTEITSLKNGDTIKILKIETELNIPLTFNELDFPVHLKGKVDRVDEYNGITRIIDYKTGKVEQRHLKLENWEDITMDYKKYNKSFQVLSYAFMMNATSKITGNTEAGIISFKNLKAGFLKFQLVDKQVKLTHKNTIVNQELLSDFLKELKKLILEIFNPKIDFIEKEVD